MNRYLTILILFSSCCTFATGQTIPSTWADSDPALEANPGTSFWLGSPPIYMDADTYGKSDPNHRTEIRTRWTKQNLYFLFVCPYQKLNLKPNPSTSMETNELWNWDVAEAFIGADFNNIRRYKEFEISPQEEWIDLAIDLNKPGDEGGWKWNSGFSVSARIDQTTHVWYGAMKIPYSAVDTRPPRAGNLLRINLFRSQGPVSDRHQIAWQATMSETFHVPERFGLLKLVK